WHVGDLERAPLPPLVRQVIEGRLARLDAGARWLLGIASVIGQIVPLDLWQTASGAGSEQLTAAMEPAIEAHLIREIPGTTNVRFTHALVRETLYHGLVLPRRQGLHRRVAELLADRPDPPAN